jgi:hypothetical protein
MTIAVAPTELKLFIPITKVDVAKRLVYGLATAEVKDRSGETCDYESTKPFYEKWSEGVHKASGGKSYGNVRGQHGKVAAGLLTSINFNDVAKQIEICSEVVDDNEWAKVQKGVYTGFSQGGAYVKRWKGADGEQRYTANPGEVSLVDVPCLDVSTFEVIKADGGTELRKFLAAAPEVPAVIEVAGPTNDEIVAKATEMAKAAGGGKGFADFIVEARAELTKAAAPAEKPAGESVVVPPVDVTKSAAAAVVPAAGAAAALPAITDDSPWDQVWKSRIDGSTHATKAALRKHHETLTATAAAALTAGPIQSALDGINAALGIEKAAAVVTPAKDDKKDAAADDKTKPDPKDDKKKKTKKGMAATDLQKGLYDVGRLANLIMELRWLAADSFWERESEGDGSVVPEQMKANLAGLCSTLVAMVIEETTELFDPENENDALLISVMEMADGVPADAMNALIKMATDDAGFAKCKDAVLKAGARHSKLDQTRIQDAHDNLVAAGAGCGTEVEKMAKDAGDLVKSEARGDALQKALDDINPQIEAIAKSVKFLLDQPRQHPLTRAITKAADNGGGPVTDDEALEKKLAGMSPDEISLMLIKAAQQRGQSILARG